MSAKLVRTGAASTPVRNDLLSPDKVRISGNGLRGFHRSLLTTKNAGVPFYYDYEGQINAEDWNGSSWSRVSGIGGSTSITSDLHGQKEFQISKNGGAVAWDFRYFTPNTNSYSGISISLLNSNVGNIYAFVPLNTSSPSSIGSTAITGNANAPSGTVFQPKNIRFSDDSSLFAVLYWSYGAQLIEVSMNGQGVISSLIFPPNGTYGNNLWDFELSGNGNHIFVFIGGSLKLFSWSGSAWQFANEFSTSGYTAPTGSTAAVNYDGTIVAIRGSTATRVFKKTGSTWAQLGADLPTGTPWVNSTGTLVATGSAVYEWTGSTWMYKWQAIGALSDDATVAVAAAGAGSIYRYQLRDVAPVYMGSLDLATSIYAGATEGKSLYAGNNLLWQKT